MSSFTGIFQRFFLNFQGIYFPEHLGMTLNTSECVEVDKIYGKAIKQEHIFMKSNFKINLQHKLLPHVMGSSIILSKVFIEADQEKNILETVAAP